MKITFSKIMLLMGGLRNKLPLIAFLYFVSIAFEILGLALVVPVVSIAQGSNKLANNYLFSGVFEGLSHANFTIMIASLFLFIFSIKTIVNIYINKRIVHFSYELQHYLRSKFSELYLQAPYLFHVKRRSSDILNLIQSHASVFSKGIVSSILRISGEIITTVFIFIFLMLKYPMITFVISSILIMFSYIYFITLRRRLGRAGGELIRAQSDLIQTITQGIGSIKEARVLGRDSYFEKKIADQSKKVAAVNSVVTVIQFLPRYILELLIAYIVISMLVFSVLFGPADGSPIESLSVFALAALRMLPSFTQITTGLNSVTHSLPMMNEMYDDYSLLSSYRSEPKKRQSEILPFKSLAIRDISYNYPGSSLAVLENFSIDVTKGEVVGIFGPSGSGKSTLVNILLGLLEPQDGKIILNETPVEFSEWRRNAYSCYIPQSPQILDSSVAANVAFGIPQSEVDDERLLFSLKKSQLLGFVESLPQGVNSPVGESGSLFSAGQKQRLAVARSFYFGRELIVLDEATSALDPKTEIDLLTEIRVLREDAAIVMVSHSDRAFTFCDRVYSLAAN